jgi:ankyrin repeat protein
MEEDSMRLPNLDTRDMVNSGDHQTAIYWVSKEGHKDAVEELLLVGGDISYLDSKGQTLLYLAVRSGSEEMVALLLAKGMAGFGGSHSPPSSCKRWF